MKIHKTFFFVGFYPKLYQSLLIIIVVAISSNVKAYRTSLSAVKKIQKLKNGMDKIRKNKPASVKYLDFLFQISMVKIRINNISCGFITIVNLFSFVF
ncbi:MAG TPA: hypothetical protein VM077_02585 [Candidatus Limnocylindrales bacterium]|nr:hypothetical protein [Candidatus Limnocylindrales bacterium]